MTQKELLYLEDALNHEKNTIAYINFISECMDECDDKFFANELKIHEKICDDILNEMESKINE